MSQTCIFIAQKHRSYLYDSRLPSPSHSELLREERMSLRLEFCGALFKITGLAKTLVRSL